MSLGFYSTPPLNPEPITEEEVKEHLLRATSGRGIVNLHHTITLYAIERVASFFTPDEYNHLIRSWITFMGDKGAEPVTVSDSSADSPEDYKKFFSIFSDLDARSALAALIAMRGSVAGPSRIGRYIIKAVCDKYQGHYNPHYLTGLGSALWVLDLFPDQDQIVSNALYQYLDYYFTDLKS